MWIRDSGARGGLDDEGDHPAGRLHLPADELARRVILVAGVVHPRHVVVAAQPRGDGLGVGGVAGPGPGQGVQA